MTIACLALPLAACADAPDGGGPGEDPAEAAEGPAPDVEAPADERLFEPDAEESPELDPPPGTAAPDGDRGEGGTAARSVTVALGGDVHGESPIDSLIADGGDPLSGLAPTFLDADLTVVNLESAVGTSGSPAEKQFTFQAPPDLLTALTRGGVDVVTVANNHSLDYGVEGLFETLDLAEEAGLGTVGGGRDANEAYAPRYVEVDGQTVAVVGLTRVIPYPDWAATDDRPGLASAYDPFLADGLGAIQEASAQADWVVVTVHWGQEGAACPDEIQTGLARAFVDAGADVVAGHHPHVLQGVQELDGAVVAYSLGNLVWYASSDAGRTTGVLTVDLGPGDELAWDLVAAVIDDSGSPQPVADADPGRAAEIAGLLDDRSPGGGACAATDWP